MVRLRAGHDVVFSCSRSRRKLQRLADDAGALVAQSAYGGSAGAQLAYRFERLARRKR